MAQVSLSRHESEMGFLPATCMRCGAPAHCQKKKMFIRSESGQGMQIWLIAPFCVTHGNHWLVRSIIPPLTLWVLVIGGGGLLVVVAWHLPVLVLVAVLTNFLIWCGLSVFLDRTSIHPKEITEENVVLTGVAPEFIEALQMHRQSTDRLKPLSLAGASRANREIRLTDDELRGCLPMICMHCGKQASVWKETLFRTGSTDPIGGSKVALLIWLASLASAPRLCFRAPFCQTHQNHWFWQKMVVRGGMTAWAVIGGIAMLAFAIDVLPAEVVYAVLIAILVYWCTAMAFTSLTGIEAREITEKSLTLRGVSEHFVQAVGRQRKRG